LAQCGLGRAGVEALLASPRVVQLEALDLRNNDLTPEDVALLTPARLPALRELRLGGCYNAWDYDLDFEEGAGGEEPEVGDDPHRLTPGLAPLVPQLRLLDLGSCGVRLRDLAFLDRDDSGHFSLQALLLERSYLNTRHLAQSPLLAGVRTLDLSSCY